MRHLIFSKSFHEFTSFIYNSGRNVAGVCIGGSFDVAGVRHFPVVQVEIRITVVLLGVPVLGSFLKSVAK